MLAPRGIRVTFRPGRDIDSDRGLLAADARVRTLRKVLVSYPEVRHIAPDRVSLDPNTDPRLLETVARFLERQHWLVRGVEVE
jgi:hypothetical protein